MVNSHFRCSCWGAVRVKAWLSHACKTAGLNGQMVIDAPLNST